MKNQQKGSIVTVLLVIIVLLVVIGGVYVYVTRKAETPVVPVTTTQPVGTVSPVSTTSPVTQPAPAGWSTYTNNVYGFSFIYPATWKVTEDDNKKEVTVTSDTTVPADQTGTGIMPLEVLSFGVTDKNFFNPPLGTKYGEIAYDNTLMTLVDSSSTPARCLPVAPIFNAPTGVKGIAYAGSLMSDPAYRNSAILTKNGSIIIAAEDWETDNTDQTKNTAAKDDVAKIANSFSLLNGNTVTVASCAL
jgi:hypothetical protein